MALLGALCVNLNALGFTSRSLRAQVSPLLGALYTPNQMSYDLGRLRLNGLIDRLEGTNTYRGRAACRDLLHQAPPPTLLDVRQVTAFPASLRPIQVDDTVTSEAAMGRAALVAGVVTRKGTRIDLVTCHLKSKLLTFPGGAFSTRDEGLRARYGAYALYRRTAEAVTVRDARG